MGGKNDDDAAAGWLCVMLLLRREAGREKRNMNEYKDEEEGVLRILRQMVSTYSQVLRGVRKWKQGHNVLLSVVVVTHKRTFATGKRE